MPLAVWLWIGGTVMAIGTLLAAWPGRRRRPTDPVSAPIPDREPVGEPVGVGAHG
jgi:cytochrome c-type biogenesis protein CcmF